MENSYNGYNFLLSEKVKILNLILQQTQISDLYKFYDEEKMNNQSIYKASGFHWSFLEKQIEIVKSAFQKSANSNSGLIINIS
jgi:hypothetical protein